MRLWSKGVLALWILEGDAASMDGGGARRWCGACREGGNAVHGEDGVVAWLPRGDLGHGAAEPGGGGEYKSPRLQVVGCDSKKEKRGGQVLAVD